MDISSLYNSVIYVFLNAYRYYNFVYTIYEQMWKYIPYEGQISHFASQSY